MLGVEKWVATFKWFDVLFFNDFDRLDKTHLNQMLKTLHSVTNLKRFWYIFLLVEVTCKLFNFLNKNKPLPSSVNNQGLQWCRNIISVSLSSLVKSFIYVDKPPSINLSDLPDFTISNTLHMIKYSIKIFFWHHFPLNFTILYIWDKLPTSFWYSSLLNIAITFLYGLVDIFVGQ